MNGQWINCVLLSTILVITTFSTTVFLQHVPPNLCPGYEEGGVSCSCPSQDRLTCIPMFTHVGNLSNVFPQAIINVLQHHIPVGSVWKDVVVKIPDLPDLPPNLFINVSVERLALSSFIPGNSGIYKEDALSNLADKLVELKLGENNLKSVPFQCLSKLQKLKSLDLSYNTIVNLTNNAFGDLSNLEFLDISYNQISSIAAGAFSNLRNLVELHLLNNNLTSINSDMFEGLSHLELLHLGRNQIHFADADLTHMDSLFSLYLDHNSISDLSNIKISSEHLHFLSIKNNTIQGDLEYKFLEELPNLNAVMLDNNEIERITLCETSNVVLNLKHLYLGHNRISKLQDKMLSCVPSLVSLDLSNNLIESIDDDAFLNLTQLETLVLDGNQLQYLSCENTADLWSLITVNLEDNHISELRAGVFAYSKNLTEVFLKGNNLECSCRMESFADYAKNQATLSLDSAMCDSPIALRGLTVKEMDFTKFNCSTPNSICKSPALNTLAMTTTQTTAFQSGMPTTLMANEQKFDVTLETAEHKNDSLEIKWKVVVVDLPGNSTDGTYKCFIDYYDQIGAMISVSADCPPLNQTGTYEVTTTISTENFDDQIEEACFVIKQKGAEDVNSCSTDLPTLPPTDSTTIPTTLTSPLQNMTTDLTSLETTTISNATSPLPSITPTNQTTELSTILPSNLTETSTDPSDTNSTETITSLPANSTEINTTAAYTTDDTTIPPTIMYWNASFTPTAFASETEADDVTNQTDATGWDGNITSTSNSDYPIQVIVDKSELEGTVLIRWNVLKSEPKSRCKLTLQMYHDTYRFLHKTLNCSNGVFNATQHLKEPDDYVICLLSEQSFAPSKQYCTVWSFMSSPDVIIAEPAFLPSVSSSCPTFERAGVLCSCVKDVVICVARPPRNDSYFFPDVIEHALHMNFAWKKVAISVPKLATIPSTTFQNLSTVQLEITRSGLTDLAEDSLWAINNTLRNLSLQFNDFQRLPLKAIINLTQLQQLDMSGNTINAITIKDMKGITSLTHLDLSRNDINYIEPGAFSDLEMLVELSLVNNRLTKMAPNVFEGLINIKTIHLDYNQLEDIEINDSVTKTTSLEYLSLSHNNISTFQDLKLSLESLELLFLDNNRIADVVQSTTFEHVPNLQMLSLSHNKISEVKPCSFSKLNKLKSLDLSFNRIHVLRDGSLACTWELTELNFVNNTITDIDPEAFANLTNLENLKLDGNQIKHIGCEETADLLELKKISLRNNELKSIGPGAFVHSKELADINLTGNQLECDCRLEDFVAFVKKNNSIWVENAYCASPKSLQGTYIKYMPASAFDSCPTRTTSYCKSPALDKITGGSKIDLILLKKATIQGDNKLLLEWSVNSNGGSGEYHCTLSYVTSDDRVNTYRKKSCPELTKSGTHEKMSSMMFSTKDKIKQVCLEIHLNAFQIAKNCSSVVLPQPTTSSSLDVPQKMSTRVDAMPTAISRTTASPASDIGGPIRLDVIYPESDDALVIQWRLSEEYTMSVCKLRLTMYLKSNLLVSRIFRCSSGSHMMKKLKPERIYKVCVVAMHKHKGFEKQCKNVITENSATPHVISAAAVEMSGTRSTIPLPMIILMCLFGIVLLVVAILIAVRAKRNRASTVSTIQLRNETNPRRRLFSRSSGSYDLAAAQRGSYVHVRDSKMETIKVEQQI